MTPVIHLFNQDCMTAMASMPDKAYELAIVDPPFREDNQPTQTMRGFNQDMKRWDKPPGADYFRELCRVSEHQIIHGGNYFTPFLMPNNNWIVWYKNNDGTGFSMCELFWSSIERNVRLFDFRPMGMNGAKIHPTQKPVALYKWLLTNYAKPGQTILDTHLGSGSIAIACHDLGFDLTGYEIDAEYFQAAKERLERHQRQATLPLSVIPQATQEALTL